jgi:hypothetical protein
MTVIKHQQENKLLPTIPAYQILFFKISIQSFSRTIQIIAIMVWLLDQFGQLATEMRHSHFVDVIKQTPAWRFGSDKNSVKVLPPKVINSSRGLPFGSADSRQVRKLHKIKL